MNHFDFLNAINRSKEDLFEDPQADIDYNAFLVNRGLSYFMDTIFFAQEMNEHSFLEKEQQFKFLLGSCSNKKRFSKWAKKATESEDIKAICFYYGYSIRLAKTLINTFSEEQLNLIREKYNKGGR